MRPVSYPRSTIFLAAGALWAIRAHRRKHTGDGIVALPKSTITELELRINKKPTIMQTKVLIEAELAKQVNKYLRVYSSHKQGKFDGLV